MTVPTYQEPIDKDNIEWEKLNKDFLTVKMACCNNLSPMVAPPSEPFDEAIFKKWRGLLLDSGVPKLRHKLAANLIEQFSIALRTAINCGVISADNDPGHFLVAIFKVIAECSDTSWAMVKKVCQSMNVSPNFQREYLTEWVSSEIREHNIQVRILEETAKKGQTQIKDYYGV